MCRRRYYTVYDRQRLRMGFALARQSINEKSDWNEMNTVSTGRLVEWSFATRCFKKRWVGVCRNVMTREMTLSDSSLYLRVISASNRHKHTQKSAMKYLAIVYTDPKHSV